MIQETCLICGLDLMWIPSDRPDKGDYYHLFNSDCNFENYKFIHRPIPALQGDFITDKYVPTQGWSGEFRNIRKDDYNFQSGNITDK